MLNKLLLNEKKSKKEQNVDNFINVELSTNSRLLPIDTVDEKINVYEEYVEEKDSSDKYRLIFTINPICSNVLFNTFTECVFKEGSDDCLAFSEKAIETLPEEVKDYLMYKGGIKPLTNADLIRDTGYSEKSMDIVYHCGIDIFNNHMLRQKNFKVINKIMNGSKKYFNTLFDYLRDSNGNEVSEKIIRYDDVNDLIESEAVKLHLYKYDDILSYEEAVFNGLVESDGWLGFINPSTLKINNYKDKCLNRCMNNNKPGEQIDMYPDRSLYSFIPKYNKYRNRFEGNWDYCLTYPYSSDTQEFKNGLDCYVLDENVLDDTILKNISGRTNGIIYLKTRIKNTFNVGDKIVFSINRNNDNITESDISIKVESIGYLGGNTEHVFGINLMDFYYVLSIYDNDSFLDDNGKFKKEFKLWVKKKINGIPCQYYIRKFRKLPNFKNLTVDITSNKTEEDIKLGIKNPFNSTLNKVAYEENIFSDKVAQIIYNDDIITTGLKDNLGRDLSEVYLTIIKRNKGNDLWYISGKTNDENVEYSHCFGKVSAGFDLEPEYDDYNIHKIHNVERLEGIKKVKKLDDNLTIDNDVFYGDIVEFAPHEIKETVLDNVYFRFNTVQREREYINGVYSGAILYDEIVGDDYDSNGFSGKTLSLGRMGKNPEGYYYKPHYRIGLREFANIVNQGEHRRITFKVLNSVYINNIVTATATTITNYYLNVGDEILIYEKNTHEKYVGVITSVSGENYCKITFKVSLENLGYIVVDFNLTQNGFFYYKKNTEKPTNAYELDDGTGRYLWRDFKKEKDYLVGDELYNSTFTNGAHYRHIPINFYLRRQDATGEYGLSEKGKMDVFSGVSVGKFKDVSTAEYIKENTISIC